MEYLPITKNKGIYYDPEYRPEKLNLSGALALFTPTYEEMEMLKRDLIENMQFTIEEVNRQHPTVLTQDEYDEWYMREFGSKRKPIADYSSFLEVQGWLITYKIAKATEQPRRAIKRIVQRQQHLLQPTKKQGGVTEAEIEQAREHPIEDLITNRIFKATGKWTGNCHCPLPGHEGEKTPSFYIDKNNRFKCFGCQQSGDAIQFVMLHDDVGFIKAVKSLL